MSYPRDLDEFTEEELRAELARRTAARERGVCDYCGRLPTEKSCKEFERHHDPLIVPYDADRLTNARVRAKT